MWSATCRQGGACIWQCCCLGRRILKSRKPCTDPRAADGPEPAARVPGREDQQVQALESGGRLSPHRWASTLLRFMSLGSKSSTSPSDPAMHLLTPQGEDDISRQGTTFAKALELVQEHVCMSSQLPCVPHPHKQDRAPHARLRGTAWYGYHIDCHGWRFRTLSLALLVQQPSARLGCVKHTAFQQQDLSSRARNHAQAIPAPGKQRLVQAMIAGAGTHYDLV